MTETMPAETVTETMPAATVVAREHAGRLHVEYRPRTCAECWPDGAPPLPKVGTAADEAFARAAAAPPKRARGDDFEPLRAGLERFRAGLRVTEPDPPAPDPAIADDGGPVCDVCKSHRWLRRDVGRDDPLFGVLIECPTEACQAWRGRSRLERFWRHAPGDVADKTLETFPTRDAGQREALERVRGFLTWPRGFWLFLWGATGRGKTGLAVAVARELGLVADFVKVPDLLVKLAATYDREARERDKTRELDLLEHLWTVPVLVLDDFGVEAPTPWAEQRIYQVVDGRSSEPNLITILTSNYSPTRIERRVSRADPEAGERLISRAVDRCGPFVVECTGPDIRRQSMVRSA